MYTVRAVHTIYTVALYKFQIVQRRNIPHIEILEPIPFLYMPLISYSDIWSIFLLDLCSSFHQKYSPLEVFLLGENLCNTELYGGTIWRHMVHKQVAHAGESSLVLLVPM